MSHPYRYLSLAAALGLLSACASVPKPLEGNYATVAPAAAQQGGAGGTRVRWGGEIINTEPGPQQTCFYVLARPLDKQARPESGHDGSSDGRFVACHEGFYDPEVFARGRELTVTGTVHGTISRKVGDYDYAYPRVEADVVYLWPKRPVYVHTPYPAGFYDPFWGPWGAPYWDPWYPRTRVIVVPQPVPAPAPAPKPSRHK